MNTVDVGVVVIGRNEGERLRRCLEALTAQVKVIVYVDSGSVDESVELAKSFGATTVELDCERPFTAARARNAGFDHLTKAWPKISFVQFIDGDCIFQPDWLPSALRFLGDHPHVAAVCGRRREEFPDSSVFNKLCDVEWDTPIGEAASCGGDALMRVEAFKSCDGFDPHLIAGEEPDLCFRLRRNNWKIYRISANMTLHDAAMTRLSQWWQRSRRSGYADAEASQRRGIFEHQLRRKVRSNLFWGLPFAWPLWPLLWLRVRRSHGALYATHIVLGKLPHLQGQCSFWIAHVSGRQAKLIEYKALQSGADRKK